MFWILYWTVHTYFSCCWLQRWEQFTGMDHSFLKWKVCTYGPHLQQHRNLPLTPLLYSIWAYFFKAVRSYSLFHWIIHGQKAETPTVISSYGFSHNVFAASLLTMGLGGSFSPCSANDDCRGGGAKHHGGFDCSCSSYSAMQRTPPTHHNHHHPNNPS